MPRRYPRLHAKDREGQPVSIPLTIAPRLFADEEFVSLPQRKVDEIAEANERVRSQQVAKTCQLAPKSSSIPHPDPTDNETAYKADDDNSLHENVGSSITATVSPERSSASSSQDRVRNAVNTCSKPTTGKKRVRRLWTLEEDQIVLCAVMKNQSGPSLIGTLPNRSRSAVLKRFYVMKEKVKRDRRKRARRKNLNSLGSELGTEEEEKSGMTNSARVEDDAELMVEKERASVERIDNVVMKAASDNDIDDKLVDDDVSLDEYESYDENMDDEEHEDIDEDGDIDEASSAIEDGYRPDEEMDVIPPL